jgi:UDPglucose--hexose-1-phosphate uridylyltransferase
MIWFSIIVTSAPKDAATVAAVFPAGPPPMITKRTGMNKGYGASTPYIDPPMQQLLVDELTGDCVILAPGRALRPDSFRTQSPTPPSAVAECAFCPGNETETPPEVARVGGGAPDTPGWEVRVVPNKFPIVGDGVAGAHEVVILSPAHDADIAMLTSLQAYDIARALRDRARYHLDHGCVSAVPFVNHGKAAGASIAHPHAQLVALDFVPPRVENRLARFRVGALERDRQHVVIDGDAPVWAPVASTTPFALRCALADPGPRFEDASDEELRAVAFALNDAMARLHDVLGEYAYNLVWATAPRDHTKPFQWWIDIVPRVTVPAGFELGSGLWVNIAMPAEVADTLRDLA